MMTPYVGGGDNHRRQYSSTKKHSSALRPHLDPQHQDAEYNETLESLYETVLKTLPPPAPKQSTNPFTTCWRKNDDNYDDWDEDCASLSPSYTDTSSSLDANEYKKKKSGTRRNLKQGCLHRKVDTTFDDEEDDNVSLLVPQHCNPVKQPPKRASGLLPKKTRSSKRSGAINGLKRLNCLQTCLAEDGDGAFPKFDELKE